MLAQCRTRLKQGSLEKQWDDAHNAVVFVVTDVSKPGSKADLISRMLGAAIVDPDYFLSRGLEGASIIWRKTAKSAKRSVYFTPSFADKFSALVEVFDRCTEQMMPSRKLSDDPWIASLFV